MLEAKATWSVSSFPPKWQLKSIVESDFKSIAKATFTCGSRRGTNPNPDWKYGMSKMLTAKQENFCQAIADGLNQSDAYRHAYDAGRMAPESIWAKASELANDGKVEASIAELKNAVAVELTQKRVWDSERLVDEAETNLRLGRFTGQIAPAN